MEYVKKLVDLSWNEVRSDLTTKVFGKPLIPKEWSNVKMSLTKVEPGGKFPLHIDNYHHIFYFIKGEGIGIIDKKEYEIKPELIVEVPAGKEHGYENTGNDDLILITVNLPIND